MKEVISQEVRVEHDCAVNRIPLMLLDVIKNTGGTQAAVEQRGNESIKRHDITNQIFAGLGQLALDARAKNLIGEGESHADPA